MKLISKYGYNEENIAIEMRNIWRNIEEATMKYVAMENEI